MNVTILHADVYAGLKNLADNSIDIVITSPPYWGQRDYGFENQVGNEESEEDYITKLSFIFDELKHKLSTRGVFFLNIGDKYLKKYGKTPLGFIPFRLAKKMVDNGWFLNDIIIWYKPNHMPSSIKNRFVNSYEPVFVFSKDEDNFYATKNSNFTPKKLGNKILKINLQPTKYNHIAVYPEKLVQELLKCCDLSKKDKYTILDPFAGSGTTLKVGMTILKNAHFYMIEKNYEYIKIIIDRCNLKNDQYKISSIKDINYNYLQKSSSHSCQLTLFENIHLYQKNTTNIAFNYESKYGMIKIFNTQNELIEFLSKFKTGLIRSKFPPQSVFFIGCKHFSLDLFNTIYNMYQYGWITRNILIVENKDELQEESWFPLFMIVDNNKKYNYIFNYQNLMLKQKSNYEVNYTQKNFIGYKVKNNFDDEISGIIIDVLDTRENGLPLYVKVLWDDNRITNEYVLEFDDELMDNLIFIDNYTVIEKNEIVSNNTIDDKIKTNNIENYSTILKKNYTGKFANEKKINHGASPGARQSTSEEYFSVKRLYNIPQQYIADYLNYKRIQKNLSKQQLTNKFPKRYKHTVGHWLRNDFGGSIPKPKDWMKLQSILDIENEFVKIICKRALKLQTVKPSKYKVPDDFLSFEQLNNLKKILEPISTPHLHNDTTCDV